VRGFTARPSDYDRDITLELRQDDQGDVYVLVCYNGLPIEDEDGHAAELRFAGPGGGCRSVNTKKALYRLLEAMKEDEQEFPRRVMTPRP